MWKPLGGQQRQEKTSIAAALLHASASALWLPAAHTLYERRQLDLCLGRAAPVTPHHGATGSGFGHPREGAWPPPGLELTPFSFLPMCCSHAWITPSWPQVPLYALQSAQLAAA